MSFFPPTVVVVISKNTKVICYNLVCISVLTDTYFYSLGTDSEGAEPERFRDGPPRCQLDQEKSKQVEKK